MVSNEDVTLGWRVVRVEASGRSVPVTGRLFVVRDAAERFAALARAAALVDVYVQTVTGPEGDDSSPSVSAKRRK